MDNYKFGNMICNLREEKGLTQKELSDILNVSDKAVSKWENGQAIPRMNVLEQLAQTLDTSVEELISLSKENVKRIYIQNNYSAIAYFKAKDGVLSIKSGEGKWLELDKSIDEYTIEVYGDINFDEFSETEKTEKSSSLKEKLLNKTIEKGLGKLTKFIDNNIIKTKCTYKLTNIQDESRLTFEYESFTVGDKLWINFDVTLSYPKAVAEGLNAVLINASCLNSIQLLKTFKKFALTAELGISIPLMLIAYPFRKMYFKRILKPAGLMKFLNKSDFYIERDRKREEKAQNMKHPFLKTTATIVLFIIAFIGIRVVTDIIGVSADKPVLISADLSQLEYNKKTYVRIDELPEDAEIEKHFGVEYWNDARTEGLSKLDQYLEDNKVTVYTDSKGNEYMWLVLDYAENMLTEDGYADYDDFDTHYIYKAVK